jgi:hypothetical protein
VDVGKCVPWWLPWLFTVVTPTALSGGHDIATMSDITGSLPLFTIPMGVLTTQATCLMREMKRGCGLRQQPTER